MLLADVAARAARVAGRGLRRIGLEGAVEFGARNAPAWFFEARARARPLVSHEELMPAFRRGLTHLRDEHGAESIGDYVEFGVYYGDSLICMYRVLEELGLDHVRLFGFDSFAGLPSLEAEDRKLPWGEGGFRMPFEATRKRLANEGLDPARVTLVKGWFSDTLTRETREQYRIEKASVIMVDCDIYSATRDALAFSAPLIRERTLLFFDDWDGSPGGLADQNLGQRPAFEQLLAREPALAAAEFDEYVHTKHDPPRPAKVFLVARTKTP